MHSLRKVRFLALAGLVVLVLGSVAATSAEAGCGHGYATHVVASHYAPVGHWVLRPYTYAVTHFDCYGHPYIVWKTGYKKVLLTY